MTALGPLLAVQVPTYSAVEIAILVVAGIGLLGMLGFKLYERFYGPDEDDPLFSDDDLEDVEFEGERREADTSDDGTPAEAETADGGTVKASTRHGEPELITLDPPDLKNTWLGTFIDVFKTYRSLKKRKRMAKKGYVKWIYLDGTFPSEKYVKPSFEGRGIPEYETDGKTYLFPPEAGVPDSRTGMWVFAHHAEGADPIPLRKPPDLALPPDALKEYLDMGVSASSPSFLDKFGFSTDPKRLIYYAILAIMVYGVVGGVLQNGI